MGWLISGKGRKSKLSNFLEKNKITQQELAERSGVSKSTISRVCQGDKFSPTMKNAQKIIKTLKKLTNKDVHYAQQDGFHCLFFKVLVKPFTFRSSIHPPGNLV